MVEQHADGDQPELRRRHLEVRQISNDGGVEFQLSAIDQDHDGSSRDNLAAGPYAEERARLS